MKETIKLVAFPLFMLGLFVDASPAATPPSTSTAAQIKGALEGESFGFFPGSDFRLLPGECADCGLSPHVRWYFAKELIAIPKDQPLPVGDIGRPTFVWVEPPLLIDHARLLADGAHIQLADGSTVPFSLVPKLDTNRSYYNRSSHEFFFQRPLRARGGFSGQPGARIFIARTICPEDYHLTVPTLPVPTSATIVSLVTTAPASQSTGISITPLWVRQGTTSEQLYGKPIIGMLLSGAQGDDDEAQGGHFAVVTGRLGQQGEWADWLVNNLYDLDIESEKGIIPAMVPMDNYLMDLNSGQAYYRPNYIVFAVLRQERIAQRYQARTRETYERFYSHKLDYDHAALNCVGLSLDGFRGIGWNIPMEGPTGAVKAFGAFAYVGLQGRSLEKAHHAYRYFTEEQTRLMPRVAFEAVTRDLLRLTSAQPDQAGRPLTDIERLLKEDVEGILFVSIPQIPSSRAWGTYPVASLDEYQRRVPSDRSQWKTVPTVPRPLPGELMPERPATASMRGVASAGLLVLLAVVVLVGAKGWWSRRSSGSRPGSSSNV